MEKRFSEPAGDVLKQAHPFAVLRFEKMNMEECNMKKKVVFVLAALAAGAAVTGCVCLANVKLYGR